MDNETRQRIIDETNETIEQVLTLYSKTGDVSPHVVGELTDTLMTIAKLAISKVHTECADSELKTLKQISEAM